MHPARSYKKPNQDFEHEQQKSSLKQIGTPSMSCNLLVHTNIINKELIMQIIYPYAGESSISLFPHTYNLI